MSKRRPYMGLSESQAAANAEALARREAPYTTAHTVSVSTAWDYRKREPRDLGDAVRSVRRAYQDEVPTKLHEGYDSIGEGGTPKMTTRAEGYLFGSAQASDAKRDPETGQRDLVSYYHAPFRATLDAMCHGNETDRFIARVIGHITIGSQGPREACIAEGVPRQAAGLLAYPLICAFLRQLSDVRIDERQINTAETYTAG